MFQVQEPRSSNQILEFMKLNEKTYASNSLTINFEYEFPGNGNAKHFFVSGSRTVIFKSDLKIHDIE